MIDEYLESKVTTATPYQLHLMVLDGALRHARTAETAMAQGKMAEARTALAESRRFTAELLSGLDAKRLPELVQSLKSLFVFVIRNLVKADLRRETTLISDSVTILQMHRETWLALADRLAQTSAAQAPSESSERYCWSS
jgi:flagellar secretion chaperone FliS